MRKIFFILLTGLTFQASAQNLFLVKLDKCKIGKFCLDCGDTKAGYDEQGFAEMQDKLNKDLNLQGIKGSVKFQVLIDAKGLSCVSSAVRSSDLTK